MTDTSYLFFDIECANNFGGTGKICSFGYVLCNQDFSVIETDDLLMNPDAPFDWYLFKKGSRCHLAYSKEEYIKNPKFPQYYQRIRSLLGAGDRLVLGFGCKGDLKTIGAECRRYGLAEITYACYDIRTVLEKFYGMQGGLGAFVERLGIDTQGMEFHDSRADAIFTMKVTEKLTRDAGKPLAEILKPFQPSHRGGPQNTNRITKHSVDGTGRHTYNGRRGGLMSEFITRRNELLATKVIKGLESRNMSGYYAANKEAALKKALELIPEGSTITMGGGMSVHEIGLTDFLKKGNYKFIDRDAYEDKRATMLMAYDADVYLASVNAMTEDGVLVNIDGNSNRVSAIAQGPKKVVFIVGMNKVCSDVDGAMKRARNVAAPINAQRFGLSTPCCKTGACMNCKSPDTICCQFLITRFSHHKDRIHVILVNDSLGF